MIYVTHVISIIILCGIRVTLFMMFNHALALLEKEISLTSDIRDLRRIRPMLDLKTASTIATSIVHVKLDHCNSLFFNIDITQINRLQAVQNALIRAVANYPKHHHITPLLKTLHWLKTPERIE